MKNTDLSAEEEETRKVTTATPPSSILVPLRYHRRKDGTVFPVEILGRFFTWNNRPVHIAAIRDITERKAAEEALRESRQILEGILNTIPVRVFWKNKELTYLGCNTAFAHDAGFEKPEDLIGKDDYSMGWREQAELYRADDRAVIESGKPKLMIEEPQTTPAGETITILTSKVPLLDARGDVIGVLGTYLDITNLKRAEQALREREIRFRGIFNAAFQFTGLIEPDGTLLEANKAAFDFCGITPDQVIGKPFWETCWWRGDEKRVNDLKTAISRAARGEFVRYEVELQGAGDTRGLFDFSLKPVVDGTGKVVLLIPEARDISERKRAEAALHESETRFRSLIQNSSDIIRILDREGRIVYESPSSERILGYPPGDMIGKDPLDYVHPEDLGRVTGDLREVHEKRNPGTPTEFRVRKSDGEYLWVDSLGANLLDTPGVNGIVVTTRPIQQRKEAEEQINKTIAQLERSEALLRKVYDILPIGLWLADKNGKLLYGNPAGVKIWGGEPLVPLEEYGVFKARRYPSEEEIAGDDWALSHTILEGVTIKDELLEIDAFDGKKKIIVNYTAPLYDAAGAIDGAIVVNQEITDKVKAEEALRENQARLATAMDIAGLVNWEFDVATGLFTFDDRFYSLYATTADQEGGNLMSAETYMQEFVYPDDRPSVRSAIQKLLVTTDPAYTDQMEHRITPRDGSVRTIIARFAPVMGPDGGVIRTVGANQDITDFKLMESEIRSLNTVLEQRVRDRTEALAKTNEALEEEVARRQEAEKKLRGSYDEKVLLLKEIHHRVKNNLQIIASLLNLQSRYIKDESTLAAIRESQNRVKAMALVHEKLYRSEDISHVSLHDYLRFLGSGLFQFYDARLRGIQFTLDIHDVNVDIDAAIPLGLILNEMISNSLKYAFPEGRTGEIAISVKKDDHTLTVVFRDTGIGIPAELDWRDTQSLGLRLVNTLVDQLNGTVELDRSSGTQFTMVLHEKEPREQP
jgi:PAS domain S-box-containing protein